MRLKVLTLATMVPLLSLSLAGCDDQQVATTIAQIQKTTTQVCSFVPTASTVANILSSLYPAAQAPVGAVSAVAQQICTAVTAKSAARGAEPAVAGVVIDGHFLYGRRQ